MKRILCEMCLILALVSAAAYEIANSCALSKEGIGCANPNATCTRWDHNNTPSGGVCIDCTANGGEWLRGCCCQ